ncbi:hypothetical protein HYU15_02335 [Candidatus Woesearchaeota archaeon]|nr:hypothetical protein [Candidatus Woesearchaeota archaeon]
MSKLTDIIRAYEDSGAGAGFVLVDREERVQLPPNVMDGVCNEIWLRIAPGNGLYSAAELNGFMKAHISWLRQQVKRAGGGLGRAYESGFRTYNHSTQGQMLLFGNEYFTEPIGVERRFHDVFQTFTDLEFIAANQGALNKEGFFLGERKFAKESTHPYKRKIWIEPYPTEQCARDALANRNAKLPYAPLFEVPLEVLRGYNQQLVTG